MKASYQESKEEAHNDNGASGDYSSEDSRAVKSGDAEEMLRKLLRMKKDYAGVTHDYGVEETLSTLITTLQKKIQLKKDLASLKKSCLEYLDDGDEKIAPLHRTIGSKSSKLSKSVEFTLPSDSKSVISKRLPDRRYVNDAHMKMANDIRSLLVVNADMFFRCIGMMDANHGDHSQRPPQHHQHASHGPEEGNSSSSSCSNDENGSSGKERNGIEEDSLASFSRYGFDAIKVRTSPSSTQLTTEADCSTKTFDLNPLSQLPLGLKGCVDVQYKAAPFSKFVNYEAIFDSALKFRERDFESVLPKLKDQLEAVRECLEEIDGWIEKPSTNVNFIMKTFGVKLNPPSEADQGGRACMCSVGTHPQSYVCLRCQCPLRWHKQRRCPKSNGLFSCKAFHVLKIFKASDESLLSAAGYTNRSFDIGKKEERMELETFLGIISQAEFKNRKESRVTIAVDSFPERKCSGHAHEQASSKSVGPANGTIKGDVPCMGSSKSVGPARVAIKNSSKLGPAIKEAVVPCKDTVVSSVTEASSMGTIESEWVIMKGSQRRGRFWDRFYKKRGRNSVMTRKM